MASYLSSLLGRASAPPKVTGDGFPSTTAMPAPFYHSEAIYQLERRAMFTKQWLFACHERVRLSSSSFSCLFRRFTLSCPFPLSFVFFRRSFSTSPESTNSTTPPATNTSSSKGRTTRSEVRRFSFSSLLSLLLTSSFDSLPQRLRSLTRRLRTTSRL
jgi:hypothetical protein